jgi:hypothetical protein
MKYKITYDWLFLFTKIQALTSIGSQLDFLSLPILAVSNGHMLGTDQWYIINTDMSFVVFTLKPPPHSTLLTDDCDDCSQGDYESRRVRTGSLNGCVENGPCLSP